MNTATCIKDYDGVGFLKENKDSLNKYNNIKLEAANLYPNNIETYIKLKSEYVKEIYKKLNLL